MSHVVPSNQVDSQGGDCTDPVLHAVRVTVTGSGGGGGGGGAVTIADGADVAQGSTTDAAITSDASGTVISFLRGLVKIFSTVWDQALGRLIVGLTQTDKAYAHTFSAANDAWVIDISRFTVISIALGTGTTNNDGQWSIDVSNDGGATFMAWFFSSTIADTNRAQFVVYFGSSVSPAFVNVAGITHVRITSHGFSFGSAVLTVRASTASMWLPSQGVYLQDGRNGSVAFVDNGRVEVNVMNTVEQRKISWALAMAPVTATVTAASAQIVAGSARNGLVLSNLSATEPIFLAFSQPAVVNSGIAIMPRERFDLSDREEGQAINAIAATGPVTVAIQEFS